MRMSKTSKQIIKIVLMILLAVITVVLLPKLEEAVDFGSFKNSSSSTTSFPLSVNQKIYIGNLGSEQVFCRELGMDFDGDEYTVTKKYEFDGTKLKINGKEQENLTDNDLTFAIRLAYTLSREYNDDGTVIDRGRDHYADKGSDLDPIQLALWQHFADLNGKETVFVENKDGVNSPTKEDGMIYPYYSKIPGEEDTYKTAYTIYNNAIEFAKTGTGTFTIYYLDNANEQNLLVLQKATTEKIEEKIEVELTFKKTDMSENGLGGAKLRIEPEDDEENGGKKALVNGNNFETLYSKPDGTFGTITVTPKENTGEFNLIIEELEAPEGYTKMPGSKTLTVVYDTETGDIESISVSKDKYIDMSISNSGATVTVKNEKPVKIMLFKQDFFGTRLEGAKIKVKGNDDDILKIEGERLNSNYELSSDSNGIFGEITVYPTEESYKSGEFKLTITEIKAPNGYATLPEKELILTVKYNPETGEVTTIESSNTEYVFSFNNEVRIRNKPKVNLTIDKIDSLQKEKLAGAEFEIILTNVESIDSYITTSTGDGKKIIRTTTNDIGEIKLTGIVPDDWRQPIQVTITEEKAPDTDGKGYYYKELDKPIVLSMTYDYDNRKWTETNGVGSIDGNTLTVGIENTPYITLSGMVWEDAQQGEKVVTGPNGLRDKYYKYEKVADGQGEYIVEYDDEGNAIFKEVGKGKGNYRRIEITESGLSGVLVGLYSVKDGKILQEPDILKPRLTDENGQYKFTDVPKTNEGYKIVFSYDGINYIATEQNVGNNTYNTEKIDSDASETETERVKFNDRFVTISAGQSIDKTTLTYTYKDKKSTLNVTMAGHTTRTEDAKFQMKAQTGTYTTTASNIDCGLVKKELDLSIGTDVKSAKLEINDKSTEYTYAQIINGEMSDLDLDKLLDNKSSGNEEVKYNLYLYTSDYNYRIEDYQTGIENKLNSGTPDGGYKETAGDEDNDTIKELEVYVTYSVVLKNQTKYDATVEKFIYYYDSIYTPTIKEGDVVEGYKVTSIIENKITFENTGEDNLLSGKNDYRREIDLTFKLDINSDAYKKLISTPREAKNVVEITEYSTVEGGLIDKDSAPGNAIIEFLDGTHVLQEKENEYGYEDDTDEAKGINISIGDNTRTIKGTVFEDGRVAKQGYNGQKDKGEKLVNDVIVQLIEIKKIGGNYYEYIWQETRSGTNTVKTTARNGYTGEPYTNNVKSKGQYEFKDFIPGNYIVRFIYGDGSTYDLTDNVKTYNGQDYKSTIDSKYNLECYNTAGYEAGQSVARDNEARRLEVMSYSATIDGEIGKALDEKTSLDKTWMAAETSKINVPVDPDSRNDLETDSSSITSKVNDSGITFDSVNFGLALRPQTKLVLEKHITGLKITPSGDGVQAIVDAKANIENIVKGENVTITGRADGLAMINSDRSNRGFWEVATDVDKLAQGAELEVEYTYVLKNDGEKDYLSKTLVDAYENQDLKPYDKVLREIKDTVKETMRTGTYAYKTTSDSDKLDIGTYLGQYYYTGNKAETDAEVPSRIETLEEAINNELSFNSTEESLFKKANSEALEKTVYNEDGNATIQKIDTVVQNKSASAFMRANEKDYSKTITLTKTLASSEGGEVGANLPSYIAEITSYSNAAGRRDMDSQPANLSYVHSYDNTKTLATENNEPDEFWAETIIVTKPTGEDKLSPIQIAIITISSVAVLGLGIVLIKKIVLKK